MESSRHRSTDSRGILYAIAAYGSWGMVPAFWKLLQGIPPSVILAHRIIWSAVFFLGLLWARDGSRAVVELSKVRSHGKPILISASLISANWFAYVWAVNSGRVLESSLGYFINPLVNVLLALIFLGERLTRLQWVSVGFAAVGVFQLAIRAGQVPYVALFLALSFGFYGLIRKKLELPPLAASAVESLLLCIPAIAFLAVTPSPSLASKQGVLFVLGGVVTGLPLLWFVEAARRIPLTALGFLQYLSPTLQFLLAVGVYGEAFSSSHAWSFAFIWIALLIYLADLLTGAPRAVRSTGSE